MQSSMLKSIVEDFGNGGTIDGDLTISGDLTVSGGGSLSFDEIIEGTQVIDITRTEAFLVRKNGDGGDVMVVDTTNSRVGIGKAPDTLLHLYSTSASKPILKIENEQGGSNPVSIQMLRNTSSPADDDFIGQIDFRSMNDASTPEEVLYAYISSQSTDITDGTEDGEINFFTMKAGTLTNTMTMQSGEVGVNDSDPAKILSVKATGNDDGISLKNSSGQFLALIHQQDSDAGMLRLYDESSTTKIAFNADSGESSYFNNGGNVGIGVTAPDKLLTLGQDAIDGGQTAYLKILDTDTDTTANTLLEILFSKYHTGTSAADVASIAGGIEQWSGTSSNRNTYMDFRTVTSGSRTEKMRITSSGKVGIGETAPVAELHIKQGSAGDVDTHANVALILEGSGDTLLQFQTPNDATDVGIIFGDPDDRDVGAIKYDHSSGNDSLKFTANGNLRFVLDDNSRISLSNNDSGSNNTVFGKDAGKSLVSGANNNTFIGHNVGDATLTDGADDNTGIGYNALTAHTSGNSNVAIGSGAMEANTTGNSNVAIGKNALQDQTAGGNNNVCVGVFAGGNMDNASCDDNVLVGKEAGLGNLDSCVAIGKSALSGTGTNTISESLGTVAIGHSSCAVLTTGTGTTAVGYETCKSINVGDQNTAFGYQALKSADTGEYNVAVGYQALLDNVDGSFNTAVGRLALENFEPSSAGEGHNTAMGATAGNDVSTGTFNTCIGSNAGHDGTNNLTTGNYNTFLGGYTNGSGSGASNQTVIGYNANGQANNSVVLGNSDVTDVYMAEDSGALVHTAGIQFPATQVANGGANVLDDYEEGTWTPTYTLTTAGDSSFTHDRQIGRYTKVGNVVHIQCFIRTDGYSNSSGSGDLRITGLPFAPDSTTNVVTACSVNSFFFASNNNPINARITNAGSYIALYKRSDVNDDDSTLDESSPSDGANRNSVIIGGSYRVA